MKKGLLLLAVMCILMPQGSVFSQTLSDLVKRLKGDTLVIKDYSDMNNKPDALYKALLLDTSIVPAGRVYELQAGGWYPLDNNPTTSAHHPTVIVGSDPAMVVNNRNAASSPPLISGNVGTLFSNPGGITANGDLTIRNCALVPAANDGTMGWGFTTTTASNLNLLFDNCIMEHVRARFVNVYNPHCNVTFRNCYFVNMSGQPCRRSGGLFDCFADLGTLLVENCTHIIAQGSMYRFRGYPYGSYTYQFKRIIINHCSFIDCAGSIFMHPGLQNNISLTNNMFINSNVQSYPGIHSIDTEEQDPDWLPMGLVNVYPDSADAANNTPRKFLVQNNLAYWDPSLADMDSILDANRIDGLTNWRSQKIIMNARTDSMFNHLGRFSATPYRHLVTDTWKNKMPHFADPKDLFTTQLAHIKTFALVTVDTGVVGSSGILPDWRLVSTGPGSFVHPDWPIPVDLSYSDADLLSGGMGDFPLGDLNWFPAQKSAWLAQRSAECDAINAALNSGTLFVAAVHDHGSLLAEFQLHQNYPNPFNPATTIHYELPSAGHVSLRVYDLLGREIRTLVDERQNAGDHLVMFNAGSLPSGVYFYRLKAGDFVATKRLILLK